MIGSQIGIYNGKVFNNVEIKVRHLGTGLSTRMLTRVHSQPEMVGFYLGEFSISYKPVRHGRPGIGAYVCFTHLTSEMLTSFFFASQHQLFPLYSSQISDSTLFFRVKLQQSENLASTLENLAVSLLHTTLPPCLSPRSLVLKSEQPPISRSWSLCLEITSCSFPVPACLDES